LALRCRELMARRVRIFLKYAVLSKLFFCCADPSPLTADTKP